MSDTNIFSATRAREKNGDFAETTAFEIYGVKTSEKANIHNEHWLTSTAFSPFGATVDELSEGSATAEKSVRDFEFTERFQDFSKDFRFQPIQQKISRFQQRFQISAKISRFREDFKISAKISDFARISAEISRFHVISGEISRFQQRFHGSQRTAYAPWCR